MKRFVNLILLLGTILSVGIVLKYSALPLTVFIYDDWAEFWISSMEEQEKYTLLYDIAVGFIMSALFYFIVEEVPTKVRMHRAKPLIKTQINQLVECMEQIIDIVIEKYNRNRNIKALAQKDFLILDGETQHTTEEISYSTTIYYVKGKRKKTAIQQYGNINQLVKDNSKRILDNIAIIKNYEYFYASDVKLVECIRKIEGCALIRYYMPNHDKNKKTPCFQLHGTSAAMIDFVNLYIELLKRKFHTEYTVTTLDSKEETQKYHNDRESGAFLQSIIDIQAQRYNIALTNPTAIISGSKYTTDILVSQLKQNVTAKYIAIDDVKMDELNTYRYVVFITDSNSKNAITHILNTYDLSAKVLLITEQTILKKGIKHKLKNSDNIIDEIFFKTGFCMGSLVFSKEEPSEKSIVDIQHKIEALWGISRAN